MDEDEKKSYNKDIELIEKYQNQFCKNIFGVYDNDDNEDMWKLILISNEYIL